MFRYSRDKPCKETHDLLADCEDGADPAINKGAMVGMCGFCKCLTCQLQQVHEALEEVVEQSSGTETTDASSFTRHMQSFQFIACAVVVAQYLLGFIRPLRYRCKALLSFW